MTLRLGSTLSIIALVACAGQRPAPANEPVQPQFSLVEIRPAPHESLEQRLVREAAVAAARNQAPLIELTSRWCRSCFMIDRSFTTAPMREALRGTYIIRVDVTQWAGRYGATGLGQVTMALPSFVQLFDGGHGIGPYVDARSWIADSPVTVAPSLNAFVRSVVER